MQSFNPLICPHCKSPFDHSYRLPRVVLPCAHTFCSACIGTFLASPQYSKCPIDNNKLLDEQKNIESFPPNLSIKQMIDKHKASEEVADSDEICLRHQQSFTFVCLNDKKKVCQSCVSQQDDHKGHIVKSMKELQLKADSKKKDLEEALGSLDKYCKGVSATLEENREILEEMVRSKFQELKFIMYSKEKELLDNIREVFSVESATIDGLMGENSSLRNELNSKIKDREDIFKEKDFLMAFKEDLSSLTSNLDANRLSKQLKEFSQKVKESLRTFEVLLDSQIGSLSHLECPIRDSLEKLRSMYIKGSQNANENKKTGAFNGSTITLQSCFEVQGSRELLSILSQDKTVKTITLSKSDLKRVRAVSLELQHCELSENDMKALCYIWSNFDELFSLRAMLRDKRLTDDLLHQLIPIIFWHSKALQNIDIDLAGSKVGDSSVISLFGKGLGIAQNLRNLGVNLDSTKVTDRSLEVFAKHLVPRLQQVDNFKMDLYNTNVTDEGVAPLFTKMEKTRNFIMHLQSTGITDASVLAFVKNTLSSMRFLESLQMSLGKTKVTDQSMVRLFSEIKNVKELKLGLWSTDITSESIKTFLKTSLPKLRNLKALYLNLDNTNVDQEDVDRIKEIEKKLSKTKADA